MYNYNDSDGTLSLHVASSISALSNVKYMQFDHNLMSECKFQGFLLVVVLVTQSLCKQGKDMSCDSHIVLAKSKQRLLIIV